MAKRKPSNSVHIYETLAATPELRTLNTGGYTINHHNPMVDVWNDLQAIGHDASRYISKLGQAVTGTSARIIYLMMLLLVVSGGTITAVELAHNTMAKYGNSLSNPGIIMNTKNTGTTILDRNNEVLYQGYGAVDRHAITFEEMPETLKQATLATEDPEFYSHAGFSWRGTARAAYQDVVQKGKVQGGSTISQQLVKTTLLTNEKSFTRKYQEVLLSMEMERRYSKDQILQMYLNTIYYGEGAYGVEAASETYFHKQAKDLTLEESAMLAGMPQSPSRFDPNVDLQAATDRRNYVLGRMQEQGLISNERLQTAIATPVVAGTRQVVIKAPHFVFYVLDQLRNLYGEEMIEKGGITVHTSLDYSKQQQAQTIVSNQVAKLAPHHATNGGLVSIDPHNGDILAMVGSIDYDAPGFGNVNVTLSQLQPGSSFKPIAYATAFSKGWNGATKVDDKPLHLPQGDGTTYSPQNYDLKFRGPVLLRRALANSLNIPAVEVLQYATIPDTITMAHNLGIQSPSLDEQSRYGLSLVLGGGEVRPLDMAAVYGALANQGRTVSPRAITSVTDRFGSDITKPAPNTNKQVLDPRVAYQLTNILSDTQARVEEFGQNSPLALSRPAAAKTGTTNDFRDNWTIGYTPDVVTAVWVGNNDHSAMNNVDGVTGAAPIWHDYMETVLAGTPVHPFAVPSGVVTAKVCQGDGGLADPNDPRAVTEVFLAEAVPTKRCGSGGTPIPTVSAVTTPTPVPLGQPTNPATQATGPTSPEVPGRGGGNGGGNGNPPGGNNPPSGTP
jgi:1A family penicillin-binding protein